MHAEKGKRKKWGVEYSFWLLTQNHFYTVKILQKVLQYSKTLLFWSSYLYIVYTKKYILEQWQRMARRVSFCIPLPRRPCCLRVWGSSVDGLSETSLASVAAGIMLPSASWGFPSVLLTASSAGEGASVGLSTKGKCYTIEYRVLWFGFLV